MTYEEAKEIAQQILDTEIERKEASDKLKELKEKLLEAVTENNIDRTFEFQQGFVTVTTEDKLVIPDGLKEEIIAKVKNPTKLSQDLIDEYFGTKLDLNKKGKMALREGEDPDLANMIVIEQKDKVIVKVGG